MLPILLACSWRVNCWVLACCSASSQRLVGRHLRYTCRVGTGLLLRQTKERSGETSIGAINCHVGSGLNSR